MKRATIFSNCQADGLAHFLRKAGFPYEIEVFRNYQIILREQTPEALHESASKCDLFIFQPTREEKHGPLSSEYYVEKVIPKTARTIAFPYLFNHGFFPLVAHGESFIGMDAMDAVYWRMPKAQLLALYDTGMVDFALWPRFLTCLAEQAKREQICDIALTHWIAANRNRELFINFNHPASELFAELAREVISIVNDAEAPPIPVGHPNEAGLPCDLPVSQYVIHEFDWQRPSDATAQEHYRKLLEQAWQKANTKT